MGGRKKDRASVPFCKGNMFQSLVQSVHGLDGKLALTKLVKENQSGARAGAFVNRALLFARTAAGLRPAGGRMVSLNATTTPENGRGAGVRRRTERGPALQRYYTYGRGRDCVGRRDKKRAVMMVSPYFGRPASSLDGFEKQKLSRRAWAWQAGRQPKRGPAPMMRGVGCRKASANARMA